MTEPVQRVTDGASSTVRSVTRPAAPQSGGTRTGSSGGSRSGGSSNGYTGAGTGGGAAADVPLAGRGRRAGHTAAGTTAGGGGAPAERRETRSSAGFGAIVGARPAIDPRFSAYVWPAIALGRAAGAVLGAVDLPLASALAPIAPQLPRILAGAAALASASSFGDPSSTAADRPRRNGPAPPLPYTPDHLPDSGELSFILLVLLCLAPLTAFAYTIVRELRQMPRWPHG